MNTLIAILLVLTVPVQVNLSAGNDSEPSYDSIVDLMAENSNQSNCEPEWHSFGEKCFKYHTDMVGANFHDAITICEKTYLAQMATIHSEEEATFLNSLLFEAHQSKFSAWIGLVRINNNTFIWLDRSPVDFTNWAPNEPNNWNSKNFCAVLSSESSFRGKWYDVSCTATYMVICEKKRKSEETLFATSLTFLKDNLTKLQNTVAQLQNNLQQFKSRFEANFSNMRGSLAGIRGQFQKAKSNWNQIDFNLSNYAAIKSYNQTSVEFNWGLVEVNFVLIICIIIFLAILAIHSNLSRFFDSTTTESSSSSTHKLWFSRRSGIASDSTYRPGLLQRITRSTLNRLKSAPIVYTTSPFVDNDSILTFENEATSI